MCKFTVTYEDADMGYTISACVKEYKVARSHLRTGYRLAHFVLRSRLMRQIDAEFIKYIHGKTRAIKSVQSCTAIFIFGSLSVINDLVHFGIGECTSCSDGESNSKAQCSSS